ncbi:hypothetical protein I9018_10700 [Pseudomonas sp. MPFS]|nr:hypothetical protein I9018_10700 [Pseudomonas sp. MPFS]
MQADVQAGRLVQLFPEQELPSRPVNVVYLPDRYHSARLRSFAQFLTEQFSPGDEVLLSSFPDSRLSCSSWPPAAPAPW